MTQQQPKPDVALARTKHKIHIFLNDCQLGKHVYKCSPTSCASLQPKSQLNHTVLLASSAILGLDESNPKASPCADKRLHLAKLLEAPKEVPPAAPEPRTAMSRIAARIVEKISRQGRLPLCVYSPAPTLVRRARNIAAVTPDRGGKGDQASIMSPNKYFDIEAATAKQGFVPSARRKQARKKPSESVHVKQFSSQSQQGKHPPENRIGLLCPRVEDEKGMQLRSHHRSRQAYGEEERCARSFCCVTVDISCNKTKPVTKKESRNVSFDDLRFPVAATVLPVLAPSPEPKKKNHRHRIHPRREHTLPCDGLCIRSMQPARKRKDRAEEEKPYRRHYQIVLPSAAHVDLLSSAERTGK